MMFITATERDTRARRKMFVLVSFPIAVIETERDKSIFRKKRFKLISPDCGPSPWASQVNNNFKQLIAAITNNKAQ